MYVQSSIIRSKAVLLKTKRTRALSENKRSVSANRKWFVIIEAQKYWKTKENKASKIEDKMRKNPVYKKIDKMPRSWRASYDFFFVVFMNIYTAE